MENVRLTIQIRDARNRVRITTHNDASLKDIGNIAKERANHMAAMFKKEKKVLPQEDEA